MFGIEHHPRATLTKASASDVCLAGETFRAHQAVPTKAHVERDAGLAGFELVRSMIGFLEKDNIFILRKK